MLDRLPRPLRRVLSCSCVAPLPADSSFPPLHHSHESISSLLRPKILTFIPLSFLRECRRHRSVRPVRPGCGGEAIQKNVQKAGSPAPAGAVTYSSDFLCAEAVLCFSERHSDMSCTPFQEIADQRGVCSNQHAIKSVVVFRQR